MITYKKYMIKNFISEDSIYGDLSTDINDDKKFPNYKLFSKLYRYFREKRACKGAIIAFLESYIMYINTCSLYTYDQSERDEIIKKINNIIGEE